MNTKQNKIEKPIQLISIDKNGKCELQKEAVDIISNIKENVCIYLILLN